MNTAVYTRGMIRMYTILIERFWMGDGWYIPGTDSSTISQCNRKTRNDLRFDQNKTWKSPT